MVDSLQLYSFVQIKTAKLATALDIGGFGVVFAATTFAIRELDLRIMVIGMICACLNVLMYGSPLAAMVSFFLKYLSTIIKIILFPFSIRFHLFAVDFEVAFFSFLYFLYTII